MFTKRMAVKKNNLFHEMASYNLSEGSLEVIMQRGGYEEPIMQVLGIRSVPSSADKQRHRIMLSDGKNSVSLAMLTVPITETAEKKHLTATSVIKVSKFVTSIVNNPAKGEQRVVLLILNFDLIAPGREVGNKIGSPTPLEVSVQGLPIFIRNSTSAVPAPRAASSTNSNVSLNNSTLNTQLTHPIASLTPYHNKWIIKARVTSKSAIRTWSNSRERKIFTIELVDESGRIRCTSFKEAVDKFYDVIHVDKVYYIGKCQLETASKQHSTLKNDYEMTMTEKTVIQECTDVDSSSVPQTKYEFVTIDKIPNLKPNTMVGLISWSELCKPYPRGRSGQRQRRRCSQARLERRKRGGWLMMVTCTDLPLERTWTCRGGNSTRPRPYRHHPLRDPLRHLRSLLLEMCPNETSSFRKSSSGLLQKKPGGVNRPRVSATIKINQGTQTRVSLVSTKVRDDRGQI